MIRSLFQNPLTYADRKKYHKVMEKFDAHFDVRKNVLYESACFSKREQEKGDNT